MPVTAKFSEEFYERLGHRVASELVDWFHKADATYRTDLREINQHNFARFDAKVEQRFAEYDAKWERRFADHDVKWERRFADHDVKWERRCAGQDAKWEQRFTEQDAKWERRFADLRTDLARLESRLIRWMFLFWVAGLGTTITLIRLWT